MAITFTNKAANEMKERLANIIGDAGRMWVSTIHSMCVKILRQDIGRLNEHYNGNFTIYDDSDKERVIKRICTERGHDDEFAKKVKFHIGRGKKQSVHARRIRKGKRRREAYRRDMQGFYRV